MALMPKVAASIMKTVPVPAKATNSPEIGGPRIEAPLREMLISALACCSRAALTVCGTSPVLAGWECVQLHAATPIAICHTRARRS